VPIWSADSQKNNLVLSYNAPNFISVAAVAPPQTLLESLQRSLITSSWMLEISLLRGGMIKTKKNETMRKIKRRNKRNGMTYGIEKRGRKARSL